MTDGERPKVVRVEVEYESGLIESATGDDADAIWVGMIDAIVFLANRGMVYRGPQMKVIRPATANKGGGQA
jgi:hypothetical protein